MTERKVHPNIRALKKGTAGTRGPGKHSQRRSREMEDNGRLKVQGDIRVWEGRCSKQRQT